MDPLDGSRRQVVGDEVATSFVISADPSCRRASQASASTTLLASEGLAHHGLGPGSCLGRKTNPGLAALMLQPVGIAAKLVRRPA